MEKMSKTQLLNLARPKRGQGLWHPRPAGWQIAGSPYTDWWYTGGQKLEAEPIGDFFYTEADVLRKWKKEIADGEVIVYKALLSWKDLADVSWDKSHSREFAFARRLTVVDVHPRSTQYDFPSTHWAKGRTLEQYIADREQKG